MAKTQNRTVLITSQTLNPSTFQRATLDCTSVDGGILTLRIVNGSTGPTLQCVGKVMIAHKGSSIPSPAAAGSGDLDWKLIYQFGGGVSNNADVSVPFRFGPEIAYLQVEFGGNTAQSVTIEAHVTTYTY